MSLLPEKRKGRCYCCGREAEVNEFIYMDNNGEIASVLLCEKCYTNWVVLREISSATEIHDVSIEKLKEICVKHGHNLGSILENVKLK